MAWHYGLGAFSLSLAFLCAMLAVCRVISDADARKPYDETRWAFPAIFSCINIGISVYFFNLH